MIEVKNLEKKYEKRTILNDVSLEITSGKITVILGESGSGKSTLLNLLAGFDFDLPNVGEIFIENTNISKLNEEQRTKFRKGKIGFIFQDFMLFEDLTVEENLRMGAKFNLKDLNKVETNALIDETLELLGLIEKKKSYPEQLSGGQKQRVAIGRTLCTSPDFIFADEPTGALDSVNEEDILNIFSLINQKYETTLVLVTHSQRVAEAADEIIRIVDGKIYEEL